MTTPYQNTYWVKPGSLLAGCYPGAPTPDLIPARLEALADAGVSVIISLMESTECYSDGTPHVHYDEDFLLLTHNRQIDAKWLHFPIPDYGVPTPRQILNILDSIDRAIEEGETVFVHCWGGKGRTGTVIGCWLARHGDASPLDTIDALRKNCENAADPSPETEEQADFICNWKKGL